jgi:Alpha-kinase family
LQHPDACGVALSKKAFGEGTERYAYRFFELAADGRTVVGDPLVAKVGRYVHDNTSEQQEYKFLRRFCRINYQSAKVVTAFNVKLDSLRSIAHDTPRVSFLPCSVYELSDTSNTTIRVLVESYLLGTFQKWNNNNGVSHSPPYQEIASLVINLYSHTMMKSGNKDLSLVVLNPYQKKLSLELIALI